MNSIDWLCSFALMPMGLALTGPAVAVAGERAVLLAGVLVAVVPVLLLLLVPGMRDFREPRGVAWQREQAAASSG